MVFTRRLQPELMDDPAIDPDRHRAALRSLRNINRISRAAPPIARAILSIHPAPGPSRILDLATGSGDVAVAVASILRAAGHDPHLVLCDVSPTALDTAASCARAARHSAEVLPCDALREGIPAPDRSVDLAMCSLFLHHLEHADAVRVVAELARVSRTGIVISDLRRCRRGWAAAAAAGLVSGSPIVRIDAPRSVEGAFTMPEFRTILTEAGLSGATVRRVFPFRLLAAWRRPGGSAS